MHTFYNSAQDSVKFYKNFIIFTHWCGLFCNGCSRASTFPVLFSSDLFNNKLVQEGVRKDFGWCSFAEMFILSCSIAVLQNQVVCGILKFFLVISMGFAVFLCHSVTTVRCLCVFLYSFAVFVPPYRPLVQESFNNFFLVKLREYRNYYCTSKVSSIFVILLPLCCPLYL